MNSQIRRDRLCSAQQCRGAAQNVPSSQNQPRPHSQVCKFCFFLFNNFFENWWWIGLILSCHVMILWKCQYQAIKMNCVDLFVMRVFPQIWNIIKICLTRWRQDQCQAVGPFSSAPQLSTVPVITTISSLLMLLFLHWSNCLFFRVVIGNDRFSPKTLNKTTIHCQSFTITNPTISEIYLGNDEHYIAQPSTWSK